MKNAGKISLFALLLDIPSVTTLKAGLALRQLNPYELAIARAIPRSSCLSIRMDYLQPPFPPLPPLPFLEPEPLQAIWNTSFEI